MVPVSRDSEIKQGTEGRVDTFSAVVFSIVVTLLVAATGALRVDTFKSDLKSSKGWSPCIGLEHLQCFQCFCAR